MSNICKITNKKPLRGYKRSNSNIKTKRWFKPNIFIKKLFDYKNNKWLKIKISKKGLKILIKNGLTIK